MSAEPYKTSEPETVLSSKGLVVERHPADGEAVYVFKGSCRASEPDFANLLDGLRRRMFSETDTLILDLHELTVVNSLFVGLVAALVAHLDARGKRLVAIGVSEQVKDLLGIVGVLGALELKDRPHREEREAR